MAPQEVFTVKELAERLRLNPGTLMAWRYQGRGPQAMKLGGSVRYRLEDVIAWEKENLEPRP